LALNVLLKTPVAANQTARRFDLPLKKSRSL
jgi:hypothetical protein